MQTPHRLDLVLEDFHDLRRIGIRAALDGDNTISPIERTMLDMMDRLQGLLMDYRTDQVAGQSLERNGHTDRTIRLMREAGLPIDISGERQKRANNLVTFRTRQEAG